MGYRVTFKGMIYENLGELQGGFFLGGVGLGFGGGKYPKREFMLAGVLSSVPAGSDIVTNTKNHSI